MGGDVLKREIIALMLAYLPINVNCALGVTISTALYPRLGNGTLFKVPFCFWGVLILWFAMPFSKGLQLRMRLVMGEGKVVAKGENLWYNWLCIKLG